MFESALEILRVSEDADPETLRKAYLRMVRRYPPEHFPEKFSRIHKAYNRLRGEDLAFDELVTERVLHGDPFYLAGLLWGELPELQGMNPKEVRFQDLAPLFEEEERACAFGKALDAAAEEGLYVKKEVE
jgi:hypothetical protein